MQRFSGAGSVQHPSWRVVQLQRQRLGLGAQGFDQLPGAGFFLGVLGVAVRANPRQYGFGDGQLGANLRKLLPGVVEGVVVYMQSFYSFSSQVRVSLA